MIQDYGCMIIVDNIPKVTPDKLEKLRGVILKTYVQIADYLNGSDIYMPIDHSTQVSCGFCFIKFVSKQDAEMAVQQTNGLELTKKNIFKVNLYSDFIKYGEVQDQFVPRDPPLFQPRPDPTTWLTDPQGRDQFVIRFGNETNVKWASATVGEDPELEYGGEREKDSGRVWCNSYVSWSPQGSYLATFHDQGIKLWGGKEFEAQGRFNHPKVEELSFSPCENYLVTYRLYDQGSYNQNIETIVIWDIKKLQKLKVFETKSCLDTKCHVQAMITEQKVNKKPEIDPKKKSEEKVDKKPQERLMRGRVESYDSSQHAYVIMEGTTKHIVKVDKVVPLQDLNRFKWSQDGNYIARLACDIIQVFEMPSVGLLDRRSIPAKDVLDFVWSPTDNLISYWSPASGNLPALINIVQIPDRTNVCSRKLFDVQDGKMVWQSEGDYLCVHMVKLQNKKKSYVLMLFRIREPEVPVEQLELQEPIQHVSWEPSGDRFVVVHGEARQSIISVYSMAGIPETSKATTKSVSKTPPKKELVHLFSLQNKQCNDVIWSPAGNIAAFANYSPDSCLFEFYDIENNVSLSQKKHDRGNRLVWDPSGRILVSCTISNLRQNVTRPFSDDGYNLYTFQGTLISQVKRDKLYQFSWRPRPKDLLSSEEKKKIIKNLKKYEKIFMTEDQARKQELDSAIMTERRALATTWLEFTRQRKAQYAAYKSLRVALRNGYDSDDESNFNVTIRFEEKVLSTEKEVL